MMILETQRLLFRPHEPQDMEPFCAMEADPEVRRYVGGSPRSRADAEVRFQRELYAPLADRLTLWATVYKPESRYIGRCGIYPHFDANGQPIPGEGTLAFYLAPVLLGPGPSHGGRAGLPALRLGRTGSDLASWQPSRPAIMLPSVSWTN